MQPNTVKGTLIVSLSLCIVCSLLVSTAAIKLRPLQQRNAALKKQRNILLAAGLWQAGKHTDADVDDLFQSIEPVFVNLDRNAEGHAAGTLNTAVDPSYDERKVAADPAQRVPIPPALDVGGIRYRAPISTVYIVRDAAGRIDQYILPISGRGLWSTLYGFLAMDADGVTVRGITYYSHAETPGLGGEVDNPRWKAQWAGKVIMGEDDAGRPRVIVDVTKPGEAAADNEIDGLSGATITSNGVENMIHYWLGPDGFGPFLEKVRSGEVEF